MFGWQTFGQKILGQHNFWSTCIQLANIWPKQCLFDRHIANRHLAHIHLDKTVFGWQTFGQLAFGQHNVWSTDIWPTNIWPTIIFLPDMGNTILAKRRLADRHVANTMFVRQTTTLSIGIKLADKCFNIVSSKCPSVKWISTKRRLTSLHSQGQVEIFCCQVTGKYWLDLTPDDLHWGHCYKTFYGRNLQIFVISYSACPCQTFPAWSNVCE
jgi:hypothetical protein